MKKGFTLIELLVTIGIIAVIMLIAGAVLVNSLRSSTKIEVGSQLENSGSWVMGEIKREILTASSDSIHCISTSSIGITSTMDDGSTVLSCTNGGSIASESAHRADLTGKGIKSSGCEGFVTCDETGLYKVVSIGFTLSIGDPNSVESGYQRSFAQKIVLRQ